VRVALGSTKACANVETTMRNFISSIFVAAAVGLVLDAVVLPAGFSFAVNVGQGPGGRSDSQERSIASALGKSTDIAATDTHDVNRVRTGVQLTFDRCTCEFCRSLPVLTAYQELDGTGRFQ
jgi:hypothetical protein